MEKIVIASMDDPARLKRIVAMHENDLNYLAKTVPPSGEARRKHYERMSAAFHSRRAALDRYRVSIAVEIP